MRKFIVFLFLAVLLGCGNSSNSVVNRGCMGKSTEGYKFHCEGYWYTFSHNGKLYNCLPQLDYGKMYKNDICYKGEKYVCHVNYVDEGRITPGNIKQSCKWNQAQHNETMERQNKIESCFAQGKGAECFGFAKIPELLEAKND